MATIDCFEAFRPALAGGLVVLVLSGIGILAMAEPSAIAALRVAVERRWARARSAAARTFLARSIALAVGKPLAPSATDRHA